MESEVLTSQTSQNQSSQSQTTLEVVAQTDETASLVSIAQDLVTAQTTTPSFLTKLKSRKFWLSAAGCIGGLLGMIGCSDNVVAVAIFCVLEIVSIAIYCISEGKIDATRAEHLVAATTTLLEIIGNQKDAKEEAEKAIQETLEDPYLEDE